MRLDRKKSPFFSVFFLLMGACGVPASSGGRAAGVNADHQFGQNLLAGLRPIRVAGLRHAERITDGKTAIDGDYWRTNLTAVFEADNSEAVYDLGRVVAIDRLFIHADNNDRFEVWLSDDGRDFKPIWTAAQVQPAGLQPRQIEGLGARGRYLRLTARGGDPYVSVGELTAFSRTPEIWPPRLIRERGAEPTWEARVWIVLFGAALVVFVLFNDIRLAPWPRGVAALAPIGSAVYLGLCLAEVWPVAAEEISLFRAVIATVAFLTLLRAGLSRLYTSRLGTNAVLGVLAAAGMACFFNLGHPQFYNHEAHRGMYVHTFDTRVYFPAVKYFQELGFDGVYLASVAALLEDEPKVTRAAVARLDIRDLRTYKVVPIRQVLDEVDRVKERFSPERWAEFKQDMRWFWQSMGIPDYLGSLRDHGGNATPVWILITRGLFAFVNANETTLLLTGLLDPVLLGLLFIAIGRTFGARASLLCMIVFGATDFPMLGSNWAGATLRFDWMVALGFAVCAIKTERWVLGGALLAIAGLLRAFPALACLFIPVPALWWLVERALKDRRLPAFPTLLRELGPVARTGVSAIFFVVTLVLLSGALFSFSRSWGSWLEKIERHEAKPNVNHVGLRTLASYDPELVARRVIVPGIPEPWDIWQKTQLATWESRRPIYLAAMVIFTLLAIIAARGRRMDQAALIGILLVPVFFYPANYYLQYIFLLPLLVDDDPEKPWPWIFNSLCLLALCGLQYATVNLPTDERFAHQSWMLLGCYLAMLAPLIRRALFRPN